MANTLKQNECIIQLDSGEWEIKSIGIEQEILGPIDFGWKRYQQDKRSFTFGSGLLHGSSISGARRMMVTGYSPQWDGFYISSLGGAAYTLRHFGVNYVCLRGRTAEPSVLSLNFKDGEFQVEVIPFPQYTEAWKGHPNANGEQVVGVFALQEAVFAAYKHNFPAKQVRVFAVGPSAEQTNEGAIASNTITKGAITPTVEWCGRGGMGSQLLRQHNIVACIFGGEWKQFDLTNSKEINQYFLTHYGEKAAKYDLSVTTKYRYHPEFKTGGTLGVNLHTNRDRLMTYNYKSLYASADDRKQQHSEFIASHFLKQFNEETIEPENFENCGEPCLVKCKKMHGKFKKDYEPYQSLGPQLGIFDQRAAEVINDHVDAMGFDAIQIGGTLAWLMDCLNDGAIPAAEYGLPEPQGLKFNFSKTREEHDLVEDGMRHARYAMALVDAILWEPRAAIFREGIRVAAHAMQEAHPDGDPLHRAVFLNHGEKGHMVPNQYWVPGMGSPMPMMGKYYVYYGNDFVAPDVLGRKNVERMVYELSTDNYGICRFHRNWSETITDDILKTNYGLDIDFKAHHYKLAQEINALEGNKTTPWETRRMADLFEGYLDYWIEMGLQEPQFLAYTELLKTDKQAAMNKYWQAIVDGQQSAFEAGPESIPDALTDLQKEQLKRSA